MKQAVYGGLVAGSLIAGLACSGSVPKASQRDEKTHVKVDTVKVENTADRYARLSDADFKKAAEKLGVEVASIKAVVSIEAGSAMRGFFIPGVPVINFDPVMYRRFLGKTANKSGDKNAKVPSGLSGYGLKEWTQLVNARHVNAQAADMGTFWGMFQLGGFNYKICGCDTVDEFVNLMSHSEAQQLELFVIFIENSGMLPELKARNWAGFARKFNGASYARRGYHTKMAAAYARFKANEK